MYVLLLDVLFTFIYVLLKFGDFCWLLLGFVMFELLMVLELHTCIWDILVFFFCCCCGLIRV